MSRASRIESSDGGFALSGELVFDTVPDLLESARLFESDARIVALDLEGVSRADSAGIALLIEWLRAARARGKSVSFINVPPQMVAIARVSGVDGLLNLGG
jgi:phospholipid transport system transporter-binding protein